MAAALPAKSAPSAWRGAVHHLPAAANDNAPRPLWPRVAHFCLSLVAVVACVAGVVWPLLEMAR